MEGSLLIKKKLALGSTWSTHYCVLNPNTCVLTHTLKGTSKEVVVTGVDACNELLNRKGKKENRFNFVLANGRLLCASCPYPAKRFEWLAAVREACPQQASNAQPAEQVAMMTNPMGRQPQTGRQPGDRESAPGETKGESKTRAQKKQKEEKERQRQTRVETKALQQVQRWEKDKADSSAREKHREDHTLQLAQTREKEKADSSARARALEQREDKFFGLLHRMEACETTPDLISTLQKLSRFVGDHAAFNIETRKQMVILSAKTKKNKNVKLWTSDVAIEFRNVLQQFEHSTTAPFVAMEFIATAKFEGEKPGMLFKKGARGIGYYKDPPSLPSSSTTKKQREEEKEEEKEKGIYDPWSGTFKPSSSTTAPLSTEATTKVEEHTAISIQQTGLTSLMQEWNINHPNIVSALEEFGVEAPSDIVDLKPGDVHELIANAGLKTVEGNRFRKRYNEMVAARLPRVGGIETKEEKEEKEETPPQIRLGTIPPKQPTPCPDWGTGIAGLAYLGSGIYVAIIASGKSEAASEPCKSLDNQLLPYAEANVRLSFFVWTTRTSSLTNSFVVVVLSSFLSFKCGWSLLG